MVDSFRAERLRPAWLRPSRNRPEALRFRRHHCRSDRIASKFGFTPASRSKISAPPEHSPLGWRSARDPRQHVHLVFCEVTLADDAPALLMRHPALGVVPQREARPLRVTGLCISGSCPARRRSHRGVSARHVSPLKLECPNIAVIGDVAVSEQNQKEINRGARG